MIKHDREDALLVAGILAGLAMHLGGLHDWKEGLTPSGLGGLLMMIAVAIRARYKGTE